MQELTAPWLAVLGLSILLFLTFWAWRRAVTRLSRANRARQRLARKAEARAERLLESLGYSIVERQPTRRWLLEVDGEPQEVSCRADLLVELDGQHYVADVKTGEQAPRPGQPSTRRQLLEYLLAFDVEGALLVDMRHEEVHTVSFPGLLDQGT